MCKKRWRAYATPAVRWWIVLCLYGFALTRMSFGDFPLRYDMIGGSVAVVYFHYRLLLDFRTVFVEIKWPILLYYWITNFLIRGDEKFRFFRPVKAIVRTDAANSMAFLQREFLPSNDTYTTKTSAGNTSFLAFVYRCKTLKPPCSKVNKKATMMYLIGSFEYRVTFLVKIRPFSGHRKWTFCIVGKWFLGKFSGRSSL